MTYFVFYKNKLGSFFGGANCKEYDNENNLKRGLDLIQMNHSIIKVVKGEEMNVTFSINVEAPKTNNFEKL